MTPLSAGLASLGAVVMVLSVRVLLRSQRSEGVGAAFITLFTVGGMVFDTRLLGSGAVSRVPPIALALVGVLLVVGRGRTDHRAALPVASLLPAVLAFAMFVTNSLAMERPDLTALVLRPMTVVFWLACAVVFSRSLPAPRVMAAASAFGLGLLTVLMIFTDESTRPCDQFKCGPLGYIVTGPFSSENAFGSFAGLTLILAIFGMEAGARRASVLLAVLVLFVTVSRTTLIAVVPAIVLGWAIRSCGFARRRAIVTGAVAVPFSVGLILLLTAEQSAFSARGRVWTAALRAVGDNWLLGVGVDQWAHLQAVSVVPHWLHTHSQILFVFFSAGVVGLVLYFVVLLAVGMAGVRTAEIAPLTLAMVVFIGVRGATENTWNPSTLDGLTVPMVVLVALAINGYRLVGENQSQHGAIRPSRGGSVASSLAWRGDSGWSE